ATQSPTLDEVPLDASFAARRDETHESAAVMTGQGFLIRNPSVYEGIVRLASDVELRRSLLTSSAGMTLIAFTLLNDAGVRFLIHWIAAIGRLLNSIASRYRKPPSEDIQPLSAP
ncbi:MAG: hypothetical protein ACK58L_00990, partial [Planctomycetota bacterium]